VNVLRALLAILATVAVISTCMLRAMDLPSATVLLPVAIAGLCYGLLNSAELLFALAVFVKLKAHLHEQHKRREAIRSQRLRKARR
jgi:hypothetical protein